MTQNSKLWLTVTILAVVAGFAAYRMHSAFQDRAPDWLHVKEGSSPSLPSDTADYLANFRKELEIETHSSGLDLQSLHVVELAPDGKEIRLWKLERLNNAGFNPLGSFEIGRSMGENELVGYYQLDGTPLDFMLRHLPNHPKSEFGIVKLPKPLNAGQSLTIVCIQRQTISLKPDASGTIVYRLPRLRNTDQSIQGVGMILPPSFKVVKFDPTSGSFTETSKAFMVGWINTRLENGAVALSVSFKQL